MGNKKLDWGNIISNIIAIIALFVAMKGNSNVNEQFNINMHSSDSLFNVQLRNAKALNDSIVNEIKKLQSITNNQLKITKDQLLFSNAAYKEKLFAERPILVVPAIELDTSTVNVDGTFSPIITCQIENNGGRIAYNCNFQWYVVYKDFSGYRKRLNENTVVNLSPKVPILSESTPKIDLKQKNSFYFCFKIDYYDSLMDMKCKLIEYHHYDSNYRTSSNERSKLFNCDVSERKKLKSYLNDLMKKNKEPLFEE
jgi:hypothetical protein